LYEAVTRQARQPAFYLDLGAPDTVEGRFELYTLHVVMLLNRLKGVGGHAADTAQALFDTYVSSLDDALREMGVGDLSVAKKMRRLGEAIYGRVKSFDTALDDADPGELEAMLVRTVYAGVDAPQAPTLAGYVRRTVAALAEAPIEPLLEGRPSWPLVAP
jgi:cytochrome b pre-mRNA-processing protein 3